MKKYIILFFLFNCATVATVKEAKDTAKKQKQDTEIVSKDIDASIQSGDVENIKKSALTCKDSLLGCTNNLQVVTDSYASCESNVKSLRIYRTLFFYLLPVVVGLVVWQIAKLYFRFMR